MEYSVATLFNIMTNFTHFTQTERYNRTLLYCFIGLVQLHTVYADVKYSNTA